MIGTAASWRRWLRLWLPGLVLLLVNVAVLSTYRFLLAGQSQMSAARVDRSRAELEDLQQRHRALTEVIEQAELNRQRLEEFSQGWLTSEAQRLTRVIAEVKSMARSAGVNTSGLRYPGSSIEEFGLVRRSIVFSAEGSYKGMRRFIHALERTEQFLILEEIGVSDLGDKSGNLRVKVTISTLFTSAEDDGRTEV